MQTTTTRAGSTTQSDQSGDEAGVISVESLFADESVLDLSELKSGWFCIEELGTLQVGSPAEVAVDVVRLIINSPVDVLKKAMPLLEEWAMVRTTEDLKGAESNLRRAVSDLISRRSHIEHKVNECSRRHETEEELSWREKMRSIAERQSVLRQMLDTVQECLRWASVPAAAHV